LGSNKNKEAKELSKEDDSNNEPVAVEDVSKTPVEDLKLSTRTLNALNENSIKTVGGIIKKSEKSLSEMEGIGETALSEIKKSLKKLGLELKAE